MPSRSLRTRSAVRGCGAALAVVLVLVGTAACSAHDGATTSTQADGPAATARAAATSPAAASGTAAAGKATPRSGATPSPTGGSANAGATETLPTRPPGPAGLSAVAAAAPGPSLTGPLPATGAANGSLVAGFPKDVVPVVDGVRVVSSSVSSSGTRLQVGLEGSSSAAPTDVLGAYVAALGGAGFAVSDSPALPGSTATEFTRGPDGLVLTVRDRVGGGTELTVAGTLTTAG